MIVNLVMLIIFLIESTGSLCLVYCIAKHDKKRISKQACQLTQMLECAKKLASGIDMVRVDLYSNGNKIGLVK